MSYLTYPRLHFSGGYLADPSTVNNTPNNYAASSPDTDELELYWNPNGTGIFDFQDCVVTKVVYGPGDETSDPSDDAIIGQSVMAVYTKAAPKLVDLDPDQQNVSEIWGLTVQVSGQSAKPSSISNFVRGDYIAGPFNAIWVQALNGPRSSASGSGVYQSQLINLSWDTDSAPTSRYLTALQAASPQQLSFNFVVNAHNNSPINYLFSSATLASLNGAPYEVPVAITNKLLPLTRYYQNTDDDNQPIDPGLVPTESYVNQQLNVLLGQQDANTYGKSILQATLQPYDPGNINTQFPTGLMTGTLGPQATQTPIYYTPSRTLAPIPPLSSAKCYFAPFCTSEVNNSTQVTLNLGNALNTNTPGYDVASDVLGSLSLVYFDQSGGQKIELSNAVTFARLPDNINELLPVNAGIFDISVDESLLPAGVSLEDANQAILTMPLGLVGNVGGSISILLAENLYGYNLRADKFVYRINPGFQTSKQQPMGETATVTFYATVFGKPAANMTLDVYMLDEQAAIDYTAGTLGTGGTKGLINISIPQDALTLSPVSGATPANTGNKTTITTDDNGMAQLLMTGTDPNNPRESQDVDGQVYFIRYGFSDPDIAASYTQDVNDLVSVQVYGQPQIPDTPTWDNCIQYILPQYGKLYPIMGRFELGNYDSVVENSAAIKTVLTKPMADALRMPVIRDLSIVRTNAIVDWINNGTPEQ